MWVDAAGAARPKALASRFEQGLVLARGDSEGDNRGGQLDLQEAYQET